MADEATPRPSKKRQLDDAAILILSPAATAFSEDSASSPDSAAEVESHKSGRSGPSEQLMVLEDLDHPVLFRGFGHRQYNMPEDVKSLRDRAQELADGIGILQSGFEISALAVELDPLDRKRLAYPWSRRRPGRESSGSNPALIDVLEIVKKALITEDERAHEFTWNSQVHEPVLSSALRTYCHADQLKIADLYGRTLLISAFS